MNKIAIKEIIKQWKVSQKVLDFTDKGLIELASKIIEYETRRRNEKKN